MKRLDTFEKGDHNSHVTAATVTQLKSQLSGYLRKVREGEAVVVLDRNQPIARLERIDPGSETDDRISRLERGGLIKRSAAPVPLAALAMPAPRPARSVVEALLEDRMEGR